MDLVRQKPVFTVSSVKNCIFSKYESSFANDAAHKTSKWNDTPSLLIPPLEERKYCNAGLAPLPIPKETNLTRNI